MASKHHMIKVGDDRRPIACLLDEAKSDAATLVWLGGFRSDMTGAKAEAVSAFAREKGRCAVRFDYSGHGASGGLFSEGTISRWTEEALAVLERLAPGPVLLVGSSMGGWIAILLARHLAAKGQAKRIAGLVLIAPAPDFSESLMLPALPASLKEQLDREGRIMLPSAYSAEPTVLTREFFEDGRRNLVLDSDIRLDAPVHILQGMQDTDVPWRHALRLLDRLVHDDVALTLIKDGDHRLSRPDDIAKILDAIASIGG